MKAAEARHARILDEGLALVSREGLQGVTLGVLAERAEMSKSGLFAHFRSKEEVQLQLLEHVRVFGARHVLGDAMDAEEGLPRLRALVRNWLGWAGRSGLPGGCPLRRRSLSWTISKGRCGKRSWKWTGAGGSSSGAS